MKKVLAALLLLTPTLVLADRYEDVNTNLMQVQVALSQVSIQGKDAFLFSQVQQSIGKLQKDVADLQKEFQAVQEKATSCVKPEAKKN